MCSSFYHRHRRQASFGDERYQETVRRYGRYLIGDDTVTEELEILFAQVDGILTNKLDKLVNVFQSSNPSFNTGDQNARVIVD